MYKALYRKFIVLAGDLERRLSITFGMQQTVNVCIIQFTRNHKVSFSVWTYGHAVNSLSRKKASQYYCGHEFSFTDTNISPFWPQV